MDKNEAIFEMNEAADNLRTATARMAGTVAAAVEAGASWAEVGKQLGISKQTAYNRYKEATPAKQGKIECSQCSWTIVYPSWEADDAYLDFDDHMNTSHADEAYGDLTEEQQAEMDQDEAAKKIDGKAPATELSEDEKLAGARAMATKILTEEREAKAAKKAAAPVQRQHGRIIAEPYEGMARPGTGKGPQVCKGCGCNNHHGTERGQVYWNDGCRPTKYDTAEETEFLNLVYTKP